MAVEDTWANRDFPVLQAIVELFVAADEFDGPGISIADIVAKTGFDEADVQRAARRLYTQPYLQEEGKFELGNGGFVDVGIPTGEALRITGAWPTPENLLGRLVVALESAAEDDARDEVERGRFKQAASWLGGAAYQVAIGALGGAGGNVISG